MLTDMYITWILNFIIGLNGIVIKLTDNSCCLHTTLLAQEHWHVETWQ